MQRNVRHIGAGLLACALAAAGLLEATALASTATASSCHPGSTAAACLKAGQACTAKNRAAYQRAGFSCVAGHLRRVTPAKTTTVTPTTPAPTTTTTAPPLPPAGHYTGTTSQGHSVTFDVQPDRTNLTNIVGGAVDETCTPARTWTFPGFETGGFDYPISSAGTFHLKGGSTNMTGGSSSISSSTKLTMSADWTGSRADGTYAVTTSFSDQGTSYACEGSVTWTATLS